MVRKTCFLLSHIGVDVKIYTYASAKLTNTDVANFNAQYPTLTVKIGSSFLMAALHII